VVRADDPHAERTVVDEDVQPSERLPGVRYRGLARNTTEMWFKLLAYNLRRADRLLADAPA